MKTKTTKVMSLLVVLVLALMIALPFVAAHVVGLVIETLVDRMAGCVIVIVAVLEHPFASLTVTE